jgi:hypothetical protein
VCEEQAAGNSCGVLAIASDTVSAFFPFPCPIGWAR